MDNHITDTQFNTEIDRDSETDIAEPFFDSEYEYNSTEHCKSANEVDKYYIQMLWNHVKRMYRMQKMK